jgi:hypothetical protein
MRYLSNALPAMLLLAAIAVQAGGPPPDKPGKASSPGFSQQQREDVQAWYGAIYRKSCPPGLAKKGNGCLPPGQAKKRYSVGQPLPPGFVIQPLPADLLRRVGSPPTGYVYAAVDGDLLKLVAGSLLVVDAIEGLTR